MIRKKTVLIVEDHPLVLNGLLQLVKQADSGVEIHQAGNLLRAKELAKAGIVADIVLLDPGLPDVHGTAAIRALSQLFPAATLVVISANDLKFDVHSALDAGAQAFISKGAEAADIVKAIKDTLAGHPPLLTHWQKSMSICVDDTANFRLSERQVEVLQAIAQGHGNRAIASMLGISENTVKVHVTAVFERMGVANRTQATLAAQRMGYGAAGQAPGLSSKD